MEIENSGFMGSIQDLGENAENFLDSGKNASVFVGILEFEEYSGTLEK